MIGYDRTRHPAWWLVGAKDNVMCVTVASRVRRVHVARREELGKSDVGRL